MKTAILLETDTATLARAMSPEGLLIFNEGCYEGTTIPIRRMTGAERVTVQGSSAGAVVRGETWIVDRFGPLGARQVKRLLALLG